MFHCRSCRKTIANSCGWAHTAAGSRTTSANYRCGSRICSTGPWNRPSSSKKAGDARSPMLKYRGDGLIRKGFIGAVLVVLVIAVGLSPDQLLQRATAVRYQALFTDSGGLEQGNDVLVSGMKLGTVSKLALHNGDVLATFTLAGTVQLGSDTTAHVRTGSLLGQRVLTVESAGCIRWLSSRCRGHPLPIH